MKYTLLTCGLLMAIAVFADPGAPGDPNKLRAIDTDGDGLISLAEAYFREGSASSQTAAGS